ncbi:MAG: hypothetical protein R3C02_24580 [Planctomycetaceae bacterium]
MPEFNCLNARSHEAVVAFYADSLNRCRIHTGIALDLLQEPTYPLHISILAVRL